jgi:Tol biopolymer transport system component
MTTSPERLAAALADRYRVERELGAGGMATVYLASDLKHDRQVAIKVLKPELAAVLGADRFVQEIKTTAALQHPHILPLFDSGSADGFLYYVMPYIEGETLRTKLDREKQLGLEEALKITTEVADALDYAHRHGVIHRDIKPENILLHDGRPMVADFGIALAVKEAGGNRLTETGLSLGTPQYMSPEQATGDRQLDARSDVYSLAAVLYEMLAGEPPVTGPTAQAMIAKLLTERPTGLRVVRDTVPPGVDLAVGKALAKTPADRFHGAGEFAAALAAATAAAATQAGPAAVGRPSRRLAWAAAAFVAVAGLAFAVFKLTRPPVFGLVMGKSVQVTSEPGLEISPALSPDGRFVAYAAGSAARMRIFIRPVEGGRTIPLSDDSTAMETAPRWAPDGNHLLLLAHGGVSVASSLGGSERVVAGPSGGATVVTAAWSPDGNAIAFIRGDSLLVVPARGGTPRLLASVNADTHSCAWAPNPRWIACVYLNGGATSPGTGFGNQAPSAIELIPAAGGTAVRVVEPHEFNQSPVWSADGRFLLFLSSRDGPRDVYALPIGRSGRPTGVPQRLTTGLDAITLSLSADGRHMAYASYQAQANIWSLPIPLGGPATIADATAVTRGSQIIESVRVSRDGRWLVYDSNLHGNADIYRVSVDGGAPQQLTSEPWDEFAPDLSPDGGEVAYHSFRTGQRDIEVKPLDGGPVQRVTDTPAQEGYPMWSPDGRSLAYWKGLAGDRYATYVVHRDAAGHWSLPRLVAPDAFAVDWSRDGRFLLATNGKPGPASLTPVLAYPVDSGPGRVLYTAPPAAAASQSAHWSPDGRSVYLKRHDARGFTSFWIVAGGRTPRLLVRFTDPDRQSSRNDFAVDAHRFYFTIEDRQSDVYVADLVPR